MKVVINTCYGGFGLSKQALKLYEERTGKKDVYCWDIKRNDPILIQVIEELGLKAAGGFAELKILEIPDEVNYVIEEYDGWEHIAEVHRTWS